MMMMMMMMTPTSSTLSWKCSLQASCWISGNACTRSLIIVTMTNWCRTEKNHHHHHYQNHHNGSPIQRFRFADESIEKLSGVASLVEVEDTINLIIIILIEIIWYLMIIQKCWRWHLWWKSLVERATVCRLKMQVVWSKSVCIARNLVGRIYVWYLYILFEGKLRFEIFAGLTWEPPSVQRVPSLWKERGGCRRRATRTRCQAATDRLITMMMMVMW